METKCPYGFGKTVALGYEEAAQRTREALQSQGFGILSEIDVSAKLHEKLGVEFPPYLILGACNPALAHRALQTERFLGLLLPCNVIVIGNGRESTVMAMDPVAALGVVGNPAMQEIAGEVKKLLEKSLAAI